MTWFSALPYSLLLPFVFSSLLKRQRNFRTWFPPPLFFSQPFIFSSLPKKSKEISGPGFPHSLILFISLRHFFSTKKGKKALRSGSRASFFPSFPSASPSPQRKQETLRLGFLDFFILIPSAFLQ